MIHIRVINNLILVRNTRYSHTINGKRTASELPQHEHTDLNVQSKKES